MKKIIVSRLDNIGDVILTFPLLHHIKSTFPKAEIIYLAKKYSAPILYKCSLVSSVIEWEHLNKLDDTQLSAEISMLGADIFIHSTPKRKLAKAVFKSNIPIRIGSARRIYHWLYCNYRPWVANHRHCKTHMSDHILALSKPLSIIPPPRANSIEFHDIINISTKLPPAINTLLSKTHFNIILHPGSNRHAPEWPAKNFSSLIALLPKEKFNIFITGTESEYRRLERSLISKLPKHVHNTMGQLNLLQFTKLINESNGIVAASTGPIHISGVLNKRTLGLYPPRTPKTFDWELTEDKWKPLGMKVSTMSSAIFCNKQCTTEKFSRCDCMMEITPESVANVVLSWTN